MSELGDRVPQRIVHLPERPITAVYVRDHSTRQLPRRRRREGLDAIADDEDDVRLKSVERAGEFGDCDSGSLRRGALFLTWRGRPALGIIRFAHAARATGARARRAR